MKYSIVGPDVSFYQDDKDTAKAIDFHAMKAGGARYVIIRAGQNLWEDRVFDVSWRNSKGVLPRGCYWFFDSRVDPKFQAKKWLQCFDDPQDLGELEMWCDFEDTYGGKFGGWKNWFDFMEELKRLEPKVRLGIYTGYHYWREHTIAKSISKASLNYFAQYPLWIAAYNNVGPSVPAPWADWKLWQFTDNGDGTRFGVESLNIDLNYFRGEEADFQEWISGFKEPPTEPTEPEAKPKPILKSVVLSMSDNSELKLINNKES